MKYKTGNTTRFYHRSNNRKTPAFNSIIRLIPNKKLKKNINIKKCEFRNTMNIL